MIGQNNVLNIRYNQSNNWIGCTGQRRGFCDFRSIGCCIRAGFIILRNYQRKYGIFSVSDVISRWAPPVENPTRSYIDYICRNMHVCKTTSIWSNISLFISCLCFFETGYDISEIDVKRCLKGWNLL